MHSVENEYKVSNIKVVIALYKNKDVAMNMVCEFEERAETFWVTSPSR